MFVYRELALNPNPISKFLVLFLMSFTFLHVVHTEILLAALLSLLFFINGCRIYAIKVFIIYTALTFVPSFPGLEKLPALLKMILGLALIVRMFFLPYLAGNFLIKTSDVSSIISSLSLLKIPQQVSIPLAVMFRFFPSFWEEKANIKMAMKIRGVSRKNFLKYAEYVFVPLLILSTNIADDISKAAECKAIAAPGRKTRYFAVKFRPIDFIYPALALLLLAGGLLL